MPGGDVSAAAFQDANAREEKMVDRTLNNMQRLEANVKGGLTEKKEGTGDLLSPQETSAIEGRDNLDAGSTFEEQGHTFDAQELDPDADREFREMFDRMNNDENDLSNGDTFEGQGVTLDGEDAEDIGNDDTRDTREREGRTENTYERRREPEENDVGDRSNDEPEPEAPEEGRSTRGSRAPRKEGRGTPDENGNGARSIDEPEPEIPDEDLVPAEDPDLASTQEFFHDVKEIGDAGPEGREDAIRNVSERLRDNTNTLLDRVKEEYPDFGKEIDGLKELTNKAWDAGEYTGDTIRQAVDSLRENISKVAEKNPQLTESLKNVAARSLNPLWHTSPTAMNLVNSYELLTNASSFNIPESLENMKSTYEESMETFNDLMDQLKERLPERDERPLSEKLGDLIERPELSDKKEALTKLQDYVKDVEDAFDGIKKSFSGETPEAREGGINQFKEATARYADRVTKDIERTGKGGLEKAEEAFSKTKDMVRDRYDQLSTGSGKAMEQAKGAAGQARNALKQAEGLQKAKENGMKVVQAIKKGAKVTGEALVKSGAAGLAGAAAFSNPWTAAAYVAVQIAVKTVKFAISKAQSRQREVDNALSSEKGAGAKAQATSGKNNMSKRDTKKAEALEK